MSRKAFYSGDGQFLIEEDCGTELFIGSATIEDLPEELIVKKTSYFPVLIVGAFSVLAIVAGLCIARYWR